MVNAAMINGKRGNKIGFLSLFAVGCEELEDGFENYKTVSCILRYILFFDRIEGLRPRYIFMVHKSTQIRSCI
jgi:hypothetical protein